MDPIDKNDLLALARDKSAAGRASLAAVVSDLFEDRGGDLSDRERSLMYGILTDVVHEVEMAVRRRLSDVLADREDVPLGLMQVLANNEIAVAYPILSRSVVLRDADLIEVVRHRTLEHQLAVTMRHTLSEAVSDSLVATGETRVVEALLANQAARISEATMEYLVDQSKRIDSFQEPILRRDDLKADLAKRMFLWVSAALRQYILDNFELEAGTVDDLLEKVAMEEIQAATGRPEGQSKADKLADSLGHEGLVTPDILLTMLREGEVTLFIAMFSRFTELREYLVMRLLFESGGEGLAIACKAMDVGKAIFASIYTLSRKAKPERASALQEELPVVLRLYDRMVIEDAQEVLRTWRRGSDYLAAIRALKLRV